MRGRVKIRSTACIGFFCLVALLFSGAVIATAPEDADQLLKHADDIRTSNNSEFLDVLRRLDDESGRLSPQQQVWLRYLKAWQLGYSGEYEAAVPALKAVYAEATDLNLRFRAAISLTNDEAFTSHYEEAYAHLSDLLEMQPQIPDKSTRMLGFAVASLLYNEAGQYDLGLNYAERWLSEDVGATTACKAMYLKLDALFRSGKLRLGDPQISNSIDACLKIGESLAANTIRSFVANIEIAEGNAAKAIEILLENDADVQKTHSARVASEFHSILARAYLVSGNLSQAKTYALSSVEKSIKNQSSKPLIDAFGVLYKVAQAEGDYKTALAYHERYSAAENGYRTETTAKTLAYQMVQQQVADKKRQIDALNERNQVLQLQQQVAAKSAETARLYVVLLLGALAAIAFWAWRTKRSQMKFQTLSRRDGLTGIINRQHFMDEAKVSLQYCAKSGRSASLILIDLDYFKSINDTHGHVAGDGVLKLTVASCLAHMRSIDLFGRLGGEEFGVFLPDTDLETAAKRAEQLRLAIERIEHIGVQFPVSASFGVTSTRESGCDLRQMLIYADSALYRAKHLGRNRVELAIHPVDVANAAHA